MELEFMSADEQEEMLSGVDYSDEFLKAAHESLLQPHLPAVQAYMLELGLK